MKITGKIISRSFILAGFLFLTACTTDFQSNIGVNQVIPKAEIPAAVQRQQVPEVEIVPTVRPVKPIATPKTVQEVPIPAAPNGYYNNVNNIEVPRPYAAPSPPAGASARCFDGTYSFSTHHSGTCSHHGGVDEWL